MQLREQKTFNSFVELRVLVRFWSASVGERDQQDETVPALLEVGGGLARFGFHGDALGFSSHVELQS